MACSRKKKGNKNIFKKIIIIRACSIKKTFQDLKQTFALQYIRKEISKAILKNSFSKLFSKTVTKQGPQNIF